MGRARAGLALHCALLAVAAASCRGTPATDARDGATAREVHVRRAPISEVLARHTPDLLAIPGVSGTGEGAERGDPIFVIFVVKDTPELHAKLPRVLDGYRTVLRESGTVRAGDPHR